MPDPNPGSAPAEPENEWISAPSGRPKPNQKPNYTQYQILGNHTHMTSIMANNFRSWSMFIRR
ncbi:hypothetical protein CPAR01_08096 [Colletotrichum paranaense]|uniref:Uncharacterized protein n=2 Tax=Colletotrichum acutatum species complex TaxID=2707335 RepID=A0AAI9UAP2_9PEZI|nr:uncharacterized protein CPAR01_08096 [Colletotrichum paranaense]KAK1453532.1 hypothetical protein CMEL01_05191 [Colletotrichum melonis]KAK1537983.1 hypothetical protein CPAR01_08096 [Colletotrichum paranaense]